jgi:2-keto-4-pentenoate hydratase/2-oxohepta-3-ene-1,7-dioic acid hydratase in catechol pathway
LKLVSFKHDGRATYGLLQADRYLQPPADFLNRYPDLVSVLRGDALRELESVTAASGTEIDPATTHALPVVTNPGKFICVGLNYKSHVAETKRGDSPYPSLFLRFNDTLAANGDLVPRPAFSDRFDW